MNGVLDVLEMMEAGIDQGDAEMLAKLNQVVVRRNLVRVDLHLATPAAVVAAGAALPLDVCG